MPKKKKRGKVGGFEVTLIFILLVVLGVAGYKIYQEGAWRPREDPLANLTPMEVDVLQQQARQTWEQVKDKKVRWGTSFEQQLKHIQAQIHTADQAYDRKDLKTAYTHYRQAADLMAGVETAIESSRQAMLARNGSIELRDLGKRQEAENLQPALWAQAEDLMEGGDIAFQSRAFEEALSKYREAGGIFLQLEDQAGNLGKYEEVKKTFIELFKKADREKLKQYGGASWQELETLIRQSSDEAADMALRRSSFEKALKLLPQVTAIAESERVRITYEQWLNTAKQQVAERAWRNAADTAVKALQTGHAGFQEAWGLLESILAASDDFAGFPVELPLKAGVPLPVVWVPAGTFAMGDAAEETDEQPPHRVRISRPFWLGQYEVTQHLYRSFALKLAPDQLFHPTLPVSRVTWHDANNFCALLAKHLDRPVRLPTEAEWEYACRANTTTRYSCGDDLAELARHANFCNRTCRYEPNDTGVDDEHATTSPVGTFKANPWGLHDMHGNLLEWCADGYDARFYPKSPDTDPRASGGAMNVLRGGAWQFPAALCRSASRYRYPPHLSNDYIGFRIVLEPVVAPDAAPRSRPQKTGP